MTVNLHAVREDLQRYRAGHRGAAADCVVHLPGLVAEVEELRAERDAWQRRYEEQLAGTRTLDDLRMREIGEQRREVERLRAAILKAARS